ncbi:MAG: BAX inhibitor (BI)-1/YccA family protein, partial [Desulfobulbaceae bacterium]
MQTETQSITVSQAQQDAASIFLAKVFNWMAAGLGITGLVAYGTAASGLAGRIINSPLFLVLALGTLGLVFFLSARINKIQASTA